MSTDDTTPMDTGRGPRPDVSALGRRVGPIVAGVGLLLALAVLLWVAIAPDNVVGTVASSSLTVPATAATAVDDGCVGLVDGRGDESAVCIADDSVPVLAGAQPWWSGDDLVLDTRDGLVVLDPGTGAVTPLEEGEDRDVWPDVRHGDVWVDRDVVRLGDWGDDDGEVVLDLGGPAGTLRDAALSPDGRWVVATDERDRVLVAHVDAPAEVHEWFRVEDGRWFDVRGGVRWDG